MELFFSALIGVVSLAFIGYPLIRGSAAMEPGAREMVLNLVELEKKRDLTYSAIKELDFDYQMGKLSGEDYQQIKRKYEEQAVAILEEMDRIKGEAKAPSGRPARTLCPGCGGQLQAGARFCPDCGQKLAARCPGCGREVKGKERFCSHCGQALARS